MPVVSQLSGSDASGVASLWQSATDQRRHELGLPSLREPNLVLARPGVFAVGIWEGSTLVAMALAMPALADDGRSRHNVPGLAHISSVASVPGRWGEGLGGRCVRAAMLQAVRRGYARVQLWTHTTNAGARRLYQREGFAPTGRTKRDDHGEQIVHYHRHLTPVPCVAREAARLVCLDRDDRVLLLHWRDPLDGFRLWEPPGGGVEEGETSYDAVVREWAEETALPLPEISGEPTAVARDVIFNGTRALVDEAFFLGRLAIAGEPRVDQATAMEQDSYLGHAWVPWRGLADLADPMEPDLLPVLHRLSGGSIGRA